MKKDNTNKGFSLTEVLVATIVMSMIMGSVLAFVQYAGDIWHRGNEKISSDNYSRMALELVKQDLMQTSTVTRPRIGSLTKNLIYIKDDGNKYKIEATGTTLLRTSYATATATMRLARNVKLFKVNRTSKRTFEVYLQIQREQTEDEILEGEEPEIISSESIVLVAPGIE